MYGAVFYSRTATVTMIHEIVTVQENAKTVENTGVSQLTMLFFLSDGSVGTGFDEETWGKIPKEYISQLDNGECIELDCPHSVHNYEYERISQGIIKLLCELA